MSILPPSRIQRVEFAESHLEPWSEHWAAIGLSEDALSLLASRTVAARALYQAMLEAHNASKNATAAFYQACKDVTETTADALKTIKAFAATTNNPNVFSLAVIPPPKSPGRRGGRGGRGGPPPATPTGVSASLLPSGAIRVEWKGKLSAGGGGVAFSVWRRMNTPGDPFTQLATINGGTSFIDESLPAGASGHAGQGVFYAIKAHRVGLASNLSEPALIKFGSAAAKESGEGGEGGLKIAA